MKKAILTILLGIILLQCLAGCEINTEKAAIDNTTQTNITTENITMNNTTQTNNTTEDDNFDLDNDCVALKDIFTQEYPELIALSPYHYSKEGCIKDEVAFTIKTYWETKSADRNIKNIYADYKFIKPGEYIKGYAVLLKKDGTIVLHKYSDAFSKYELLEKDGEDRFLSCKKIKTMENKYLIDYKKVSQEVAADNVTTLLSDLDCILIMDGVVSKEVEQSSKNLSSIQLTTHDAMVLCLSQSAENASEEIDKSTMWSEFAGTYNSDCGEEEATVEITIENDGSFVGEYKGLPAKVNKTVDGKHVKECMDYAKFHGTFTNARKMTEIEYHIECNDFSYMNDKEYEVKEDVLYNYCEPESLRRFSQFVVYKKGTKLDDMAATVANWYAKFAFNQGAEFPYEIDRNVLVNLYIDSHGPSSEKNQLIIEKYPK